MDTHFPTFVGGDENNHSEVYVSIVAFQFVTQALLLNPPTTSCD